MCAISSTRIAKIILGRVKVKDLTIRIFYNFFYILSQGIIAAIYRKRSIKKPPSKFHVLEACKKTRYLIGRLGENPCYSSFDFPGVKQIR